MQDDVVDHVVLVLGLVETEGAAEVSLVSRFRLEGMVASCHVHLQGPPKEGRREWKTQTVYISNKRLMTLMYSWVSSHLSFLLSPKRAFDIYQ